MRLHIGNAFNSLKLAYYLEEEEEEINMLPVQAPCHPMQFTTRHSV